MKNRNVCIPVNQFNKISWYCLGKANSWLAVVVICSTQATQVQHNKIQEDRLLQAKLFHWQHLYSG